MSAKKLVRAGTSFLEFDSAFPDSQMCLRHLFNIRFGAEPKCPRCGNPTDFLPLPGTYRFNSRCCFGASVNPRTGTIFARSNLPLITWYRCMLYLINASNGVTISFVRKQFGISHKAAYRMLTSLREHLFRLERVELIGEGRGQVFVDEVKFQNVKVRGGRKGIPHRLLVMTDGFRFSAIQVPRGKFSKSAKYLTECVLDDCRIEIRHAETHRKLFDFRERTRLAGRPTFLATDPDRAEYHLLSVFAVKLKLFILKSHLWVSSGNLDGYLGHFTYLYNRRDRGETAFCEAIGCHPAMQ